MKFEDIASDGICEVCGNKAKVAVLASSMGPCSFAYCKDCLSKGLEPYSAIIGCYSSTDADSINDFADRNEKVLSEFYHKTKEEFISECTKAKEEFENHIKGLM